MKTYAEWSPTPNDRKGAFLGEDRSAWIVAPIIRTRDSDCLEESNFAAALESLGGESETVEVHRFGHWGPGWFEIILVDPARSSEIQTLEEKLLGYPILDDDDFADREWTLAVETWFRARIADRVSWLKKFRLPILAARRDEFPDDPQGSLFEHLAGGC